MPVPVKSAAVRADPGAEPEVAVVGAAASFAGEVAGDVAGEVAGDVAGEVAGDVAGEVAGDVAGEVAGADVVLEPQAAITAAKPVESSTARRGIGVSRRSSNFMMSIPSHQVESVL